MSGPYWLVGLSFLTVSSAQAHLGSNSCFPGALPNVVDVYPTSDRLPENTLRFYIYFSAPMDRASVFSAISLNDRNGQNIENGFLKNVNDLWSPDGTRLTLLMDPGRVKTGLYANDAFGQALKAGGRYTLSIGTTATSNQGCPLSEPHLKTFEVSDRDQSVPNPLFWSIAAPDAGSFDSLKIEMSEMIDHLSLAYRIRVLSSSDAPIPGRIDIGAEERAWYFTPHNSWDDDEYTIRVDPVLEDIAGNRMTGLFDRPVDADQDTMPKPRYIQFNPVSAP